MAHRKTRLQLSHQGLRIDAGVRTRKLDPDELEEDRQIVRRDRQTGERVVRQFYDQASGEPLSQGYGYRWVTESGEPVPNEDVDLYVVTDGQERPFSRHEPTIGSERPLHAEAWIPVATIDEYLVERVYECWGEEPADDAQLYELATHIRDFDEAPVVPFIMQSSIDKEWGILTPVFYEDTFSLLIRVTSRKIEPTHRMPQYEELRPLEQEAPFM